MVLHVIPHDDDNPRRHDLTRGPAQPGDCACKPTSTVGLRPDGTTGRITTHHDEQEGAPDAAAFREC
jgi:hypothetical protein